MGPNHWLTRLVLLRAVFVVEIKPKQIVLAILCLKCNNINLLFIELMPKISITFAVMHLFRENGTFALTDLSNTYGIALSRSIFVLILCSCLAAIACSVYHHHIG